MMQPLSIIYVDDEALALKNFKATMDAHPLFQKLSLFLSSNEALTHASSNPIDIAFLDIDLPGTSGFALSETLKELHPNIQIAFVTGNIRYMSSQNQVVRAPYIFKPYCKEDILDALPLLNGAS